MKKLSNNKKIIYYIEEILKKWNNKYWIKSRIIYHIIRRVYLVINNPLSVPSILDLDWENLLILDACRYDAFNCLTEKYFNKSGDYIVSRGTETPEFLINNFIKYNELKFEDIIYITANPWVDIICKNTFFKLVSVWKYYWDEKLGTVHPYYINKTAIYIKNKYPDKKIIVHYLQPHNPYIGVDYVNLLSYDGSPHKNPKGKILTKPFKVAEVGKLPIEKLWNAYLYNLKIVFFYALYLSYNLRGKTVITADHGEAFGEKLHPLIPIRIYGHPPGVRIPVLVKVPWFIVENDIWQNNNINIKEIKKELIKFRHFSNIKSEKQMLKRQINKLKDKNKFKTK